MAKERNVELEIRAKNLTKDAFEKVSQALKALEDQSERTSTKGQASWGKWFATISGGVAVGNLLSSAFKSVGGLLASIPGHLLEIAKRGNDVADVRDSFQGLAGGVEEANDILSSLRSSFGHTVSDFELMKSSNDLLRKGVRLTADEFGNLVQGARILANQVGGNGKENFDKFLSAIAKGNEKELRDLGVNMANVERSVNKHAAALGKEASALTVAQRQQALKNAALAEANRLLAENGPIQNGFNDNLQAATTFIENWRDRLGEAIATSPQLNVALARVTEAMHAAFGEDQQTQVKNLATLIGHLAIAGVKAASLIVGGAQMIASAYYTARGAVDSVFKSFTDREVRETQRLVDTYQKMVDRGVQSAKPRLDELKSRLDYLKGFSQGLGDDAADAAATNARLSRMAQDAQQWLGQLAVDMRNAGEATGETRAKVGGLGSTAAGAGDDIGALSDRTKKFLQTLKELNAEIGNRKDLDDTGLTARFGKDALKAVQQAKDLGLALDTVPPKIRKIADAEADLQLAEILGKVPSVVSGIGTVFDELDKQQQELFGRSSAGWAELRDGMIEAQERMTDAVRTGTDKKIAEINRAEKAEIASFAHLKVNDAQMYRDRLQAVTAYYQHQRDLANGTADTIEQRMEAQGIHTREVLDQMAADATRDYEQMLASGKYSSAQLQAAWQRMVDANIAAQGKWSQQFNSWISAIPGMLQSALTGGGGLGGFAKSFASMIGGDLGKGLFEEGGMFGGLTKNLLAGKGFLAGIFGKTFSGALGVALPGIGSALGALAGPLIGKIGGWFKGLFSKPEWKKVQSEVSRDLGEGISQGLAQQITELAKTIEGGTKDQRRKIAELLSLSSIIQEQGGAGKADVDRYARQAIQLFDVIARGGKEAGKARQELGKVFSELVTAADATNRVANQSLIDIVQQAERTGESIKEVDAFIADMDAKAASGFNKLAGGFGAMISKAVKDGSRVRADLARAQQDLADLTRRAEDAERDGDSTAALDYRAQIGETSRQIEQLTSQLSFFDRSLAQAGATGQASFDRLGRFAVLAAENIRASGGNLFDVFDQIGAGLDSLQGAQDSYYFSNENGALASLMAVRQVLTTHQELGDMVVGLNELMVGTANRGKVTQGVFSDLGAQAVENQQAMEAAGLTADQAMDAQRDTLQGLYELQQRYNLTLGEQEQQLLDAAKAAGVVGDAHKSASERMVDGLKEVNENLRALLEGMGIKLPQAVKAGVDRVVSEVGRAEGSLRDLSRNRKISIDVEYNDPGHTPDISKTARVSSDDGPRLDLPDNYDPYAGSTIDVRGAAGGGLYTKPTFRVFAEQEPEIAGSPNAIVDALAAAMQRTGSMSGSTGPSAAEIADAIASVLSAHVAETTPPIVVIAGGNKPDDVMAQIKRRLPRAVKFNEDGLREALADALGGR